MRSTDLDRLETTAYRDSYSDGVVDLFAGLGLIWIGACWLWFEAIAPFAAILPAALAPTLIPIRRRLTESRAGYVRWTARRRTWERRQLVALGLLGAGVLAIVVVLTLLLPGSGVLGAGETAAAIPAVLVLIPTVVLAVVSGLRRLWAYALLIVVAAVVTVMTASSPGWPLLVGGIGMALTGLVLLVRFLRTTPAGDAA